MGSGIAQVCATAGFDVTVLEVEQKYLDKGFAGIEKSLAKFAEKPVEKGGITRSRSTRFGRGLRAPLTKRTSRIATSSSRPSLRTSRRRRRCMRRSMPW